MEEKIYLAILHCIGFTQKKLHAVFNSQQNYKQVYETLSQNKLREYGFNENQVENILIRKNKISLKQIENILEKRQVQIISIFDDEYPDDFRELSSVPFVFYLRGKYPSGQKISIVGSRKISSYGEKIIQNFVPEIGKYFTIVSGGAAGCDTMAHKVSLENNINTFSIIGTGIDQDYPTNNKILYDNIVEQGGGVMSIFAIGEVGNPYNFPIRNEIVACIGVGTLIVEAKKKSGTLITARLALEYGRELFAVPGDIFLLSSAGSNILIQNGSAYPTLSGGDILTHFNIGNKIEEKIGVGNISKISFQDDIEEKIYNLLLIERLNINEIAKKLSIDVMTLGFKMSMLEVGGLVKKSLSGDYEIQ